MDNVSSANSVHSVHKFQAMDGPRMANSVMTSHAKWQVGNSSGNPPDPDNPDNPPDPVLGGAVRDLTSSCAGGQDDGIFQKLLQISEDFKIPENLDYDQFSGLSNEVKSKFKKIKPKTLGQALRIDGITPAAVYILLSHVKRKSIKHIA